MDFLKSILGFYFWTVIISFAIGYNVGGYQGLTSEPESFNRFVPAFTATFTYGPEKQDLIYQGVLTLENSSEN